MSAALRAQHAGRRAQGRSVSRTPNAQHRKPARGIILAVVLLIIGMLALIMTSFMFYVQAELSGIRARASGQQLRLAAESGLEEVVALLRAGRDDASAWYSNPARFRHALVWGVAFDRESDPLRERGSRLEYLEDLAGAVPETYRWSGVARHYDAPQPEFLRFGVTPESSKLNLNTASDAQIANLLTPILLDLGVESPRPLIDALLDWRDADSETRSAGAENEYYTALEPGPPYNCKDGPFDTIEELLLVKGFTAAMLYGEDTNRNGILDLNEDDGDLSFPAYDNADGVLNVGIAPFLTIFSREPDTASDNKPRINLNSSAQQIALQFAQYFQGEGEEQIEGPSPATLAFITQLKENDFDFSQLGSVAELYAPTEVPDAAAGAGDPNADPNAGDPNAGGDADPNAPGAVGDGPEPIEPFVPRLHPELAASPVTLEELPILMDYFSVRPVQQAQQPVFGRINVNTAPRRVLELVPGMTADLAAAIVAGRLELSPEALKTPAWLVTEDVVGAGEFKAIAPFLTTKAYQQHVEILGYADHLKQFVRYEWIIEMIGPLPQVKYYRDLTRLGMGWPIDDDSRQLVQ